MSPQTSHTHPDWEQNADSSGNAGSVLCSRNRYPRARGKLPESTEISGPHRRSKRTTRALESRRATARRRHWRILGWIFFREEYRRVQINARRTGRTVTLRTPSAGVPDVPQTQERGFADATIVIRKRSLKPFLASLVAQGVPLSSVSPVGITILYRRRGRQVEEGRSLVSCTVSVLVLSLCQQSRLVRGGHRRVYRRTSALHL